MLIQGKGQASNWFKISDSVHCNVHFKKHNLVDEADVFENKFDLILCRNVLIYFERETISKLMSKLHKSLAHKGCLFIGHSESIQNEKKIFESLQVSVFSKK